MEWSIFLELVANYEFSCEQDVPKISIDLPNIPYSSKFLLTGKGLLELLISFQASHLGIPTPFSSGTASHIVMCIYGLFLIGIVKNEKQNFKNDSI